MTITITAFERSPDGGKGLVYQRAFAAQLAVNTGRSAAG